MEGYKRMPQHATTPIRPAKFRAYLDCRQGLVRRQRAQARASLAYYTLFSIAPSDHCHRHCGFVFGAEAVRGEMRCSLKGDCADGGRLSRTRGMRAARARRHCADHRIHHVLLAATGVFLDSSTRSIQFSASNRKRTATSERSQGTAASFGLVLSIGFVLWSHGRQCGLSPFQTVWRRAGAQARSLSCSISRVVGGHHIAFAVIYRFFPT